MHWPGISSWLSWRTIWQLVLLSGLVLVRPTVAELKAADYFVYDLPGAPKPIMKMHAGHIEVDPEHQGHLFFWLYHNRHIADKQRLVIWLNGGPGCSSEDGALMEIGPYRVRSGGNLEVNNGSWDEFANLLFVDNPVGAGFSYINTNSYLTELDQMTNHFIIFMEKWFSIFPEFAYMDIYIAGESYAGQYNLHIAKAILDRNQSSPKKWPLKGVLIGNAWISAVEQYTAYLRFAYERGMIKAGSEEARAVEAKAAICAQVLSDGGKDHIEVRECESVLVEILFQSSWLEGSSRKCFNMYDIRLHADHPQCGTSWPPDLEHVQPYLRRPDVIKALNIDHPKLRQGWQECNGAVAIQFNAFRSIPSVKLLPEVLSHIPVLLYSGRDDFICNYLGTEELIHNLEWNGGKGFELSPGTWAPRRTWTFGGEAAGFYQEARNLTYVLFYNSSHMVPFDLPRRSRAMLDRFMGVDIADIGGLPTLSLIDGDQGPQISVGGTPNSTLAHQEQTDEIKNAEWKAYRKSGEVALVIVVIAVSAWAFFVWRARRRRGAAYQGLWTSDPDEDSGLRLNSLAGGITQTTTKGHNMNDLEAADFDENELDDMAEASSNGSIHERRHTNYQSGKSSSFTIADESED